MTNSSMGSGYEKPAMPTKTGWSLRRKLIIAAMVSLTILAIALGVGLGVARHHHHHDDSDDGSSSDGGNGTGTGTTPPSTNGTVNSSGIWQPTAGTTWNYELYAPLEDTATDGISVWGLDLFDNVATTVSGLQAGGAKVICYFSAGSYENWRPDKDEFDSDDMGDTLSGWPDERWLNVSSPNVRKIMAARMDIAVEKGCNGVDPDNIDGYENVNGLDLTEADAVSYITYLAEEAHARNLSIGLKNGGTVLPEVIDLMQWSINEQCIKYNECNTFAPFIEQNKPVFHIEYPKGDKTNNNNAVTTSTRDGICDSASAKGFSTIIKNMRLDEWLEAC